MTKQEAQTIIRYALEQMYSEGGRIIKAWEVIEKELRK